MNLNLAPEILEGLRKLTPYIWWKKPDETLKYPDRLIAQVMNMGTFKDVGYLVDLVGEDVLREVLFHAEVGQLNAKSWCYWHYRLTDIGLDEVPPMPVRRFCD